MLFYISSILSSIHFLSAIIGIFLFAVMVACIIESCVSNKQIPQFINSLGIIFVICLCLAIITPDNLANQIYMQKQYDSLKLLEQKNQVQLKWLDAQLEELKNYN